MRCTALPGGIGRCGAPADVHARAVLARTGTHIIVTLCRPCVDDIAIVGLADGEMRAWHPLAPACRHPESRWADDRCVIDTTDVTVADFTRQEVLT